MIRILAMAALLVLGGPASVAAEPASCPVGSYRLTDGDVIDVGPSNGGALRWRRLEGETGKLVPSSRGWVHTQGWTERPDPRPVIFGPCAAGTLRLGAETGERIPLAIQDTTFVSHGATLSGRLVMPPSGSATPIVILLHGSERHSAREFDALQRLLPAIGVGAFVYDKRGTGDSEGTYTQDFGLLADDAAAALAEARRLAGPRAGRIGYLGPSQGGWVAPIAAGRSDADFVIVSFGLAVSVIDEDQEAIAFEMGLKGYGPEDIAKGLEVGRAAEALFESGFTEGFEAFDAVRDRYRGEPWYKDVRGNFTHFILPMTADEIRKAAPNFRFGTPWRYDPMPTLAGLKTPQLWILGGQDLDAPSGETSRRLTRLIDGGRPITLALYPEAEHGMTEFEIAADGSRVSTRYAAGYYRLIRDYARGDRLTPPYGAARIIGAAPRGP
jgi:pimeloyl-ACP methyl ester carboxylesterase